MDDKIYNRKKLPGQQLKREESSGKNCWENIFLSINVSLLGLVRAEENFEIRASY